MPISRNKPPPSPPAETYICPAPAAGVGGGGEIKFGEGGGPVRRILTAADHALFTASGTHGLVLAFIRDLNTAVYNRGNSQVPDPLPPLVAELSRVLDRVRQVVDQFPPEDAGGSRFGNKSFRAFYDRVAELAQDWGAAILHACSPPSQGWGDEEKVKAAAREIMRYFCEAWGNRTRIDYGSGHELNFVCWILCFRELGLLPPETYPSLVLHLFLKYLHLVRHLQTTYYLEPAGSHGVWGLDDYQFLPFLFGSAQLYSHPHLRPKSIHDEDVLGEYGDEYMYLGCIQFINSIKTTAGLRWHSPMLDDISGALNWAKVNKGMILMYEKEVLGKLAVMQHFMFGALLPAAEGMSPPDDDDHDDGMDVQDEGDEAHQGSSSSSSSSSSVHVRREGDRVIVDREGMQHVHSTWGECCGIKVPSAIGARDQLQKQQLRKVPRIPFD